MLRKFCGSACAWMVMLLLVGALWATSYGWVVDFRSPARVGQIRCVGVLYRGLLSVQFHADAPVREPMSVRFYRGNEERGVYWDELNWADSYAGFSASEGLTWISVPGEVTTARRWDGVVIPMWGLMAITLIVPSYRLCCTVQTRRRASQGQCIDCGYQLGGLTGTCPACVARRQMIGSFSRLSLVSPV